MLELVANAPSPHAGHFRMARLLLSRGADINLCHPQICGLVPLHFAVMEAIQALAETLQISNGEAIELIMREEANVPDYA